MSNNEEWQDITNIDVGKHQDYVRKITGIGYTIRYQQPADGSVDLEIQVWKNKDRAGRATFVKEEVVGGNVHHAFCENVLVESAHRDNGICNAMYIIAEHILQLPLKRDVWEDERSSAAKGCWDQQNRPFGPQ